MWQQLWFLANMVFVTLAIVFLFVHRSVSIARLENNQQKVSSMRKTRTIVGICTIVAFVVMASFFLVNMRING
ncbi:hypothetical protein A8990_12877 [Paenibacillus taihuensis]|uniref:Uncharacterized protein n=1 Tax=Paenibacillus taihuensis TaxID=1156355 RepID=A0A3D9QX51_9BACL|nr:hypothetical protein [Paenibacillus taihuensis]REE70665.1 hypothetical protein A8990_12877 [Paenibacillus taihuensis]